MIDYGITHKQNKPFFPTLILVMVFILATERYKALFNFAYFLMTVSFHMCFIILDGELVAPS